MRATHSGLRKQSMLLAAAFAATIAAPATFARADEYEAGQVQVLLMPGVSIETINARYGTTTLKALHPLYLLDVPANVTEDDVLLDMDDDLDIDESEYAWENETPEGTRQMVVAAIGGTINGYLDQSITTRLHLDEAHQHTTGEGVIVAIIDSGVALSHPALAGALLPNGYDFVDNDSDPTDVANGTDDDLDGDTDEGAGHGTMIAGIVHLVAPGAKILPIRVLDDEGRGDTFTVAQGIRWAVDHGATVINLSLGLDSKVLAMEHEIIMADAAGITVVGAAGNAAAQDILYPAREDGCLSVAAVDSLDVKATFSNHHSDVDLSAPGDGVYAPYHDGAYAIGAGTSFAAPFVSGQAALIRSLNPGLSGYQVRHTVRLGVVPIDALPGNQPYQGQLGTGRFDALVTFQQTPVAADVNPPLFAATPLRVVPNPSSVGTVVAFERPTEEASAITIIDASGRIVRRLEASTSTWDGLDEGGRSVAAGIYFARAADSTGRLAGGTVVRIAR